MPAAEKDQYFYTVLKKIAEFLNSPNAKSYTGHCFHPFTPTMLANSGADLVTVKRVGSWKSSSVAGSYIENVLESKLFYQPLKLIFLSILIAAKMSLEILIWTDQGKTYNFFYQSKYVLDLDLIIPVTFPHTPCIVLSVGNDVSV